MLNRLSQKDLFKFLIFIVCSTAFSPVYMQLIIIIVWFEFFLIILSGVNRDQT